MKLPDGGRANIEIKARYPDLEKGARIALSLGGRDEGTDRQTDVYFRTPRGRLKLRRSAVAGDQLVVYLRPDVAGPRRSDYEVIPTRRDGRARELLEAIFGVEVVVEKVRRIFHIHRTRVHLDQVSGLGSFLELEAIYPDSDDGLERAAREHVGILLESFGVRRDDLVPCSYRDLLLSRAK